MAATRGDEAAVPASSKAPRVAGKARRRGALIVANASRLVRATNGFDCIDPLTDPKRDPITGHLTGQLSDIVVFPFVVSDRQSPSAI